METEYDAAMKIVCQIIESQMTWRSERVLREDLMRAFALIGEPCPQCEHRMTWTSTAPVPNAPMEWRCFSCPADLGDVAAEQVIEINEDGQVSVIVKGPIRDGQ